MHRFFYQVNNWKVPSLNHPDDYPHVAPFLAVENFTSSPVHSPTFCFSSEATANILLVQQIKKVLFRLDNFIQRNKLHNNPCLISQAGAQTTMRLASKVRLRRDWTHTIEMPFCLHITETGYCQRVFDIDDLHEQVQWLLIFEQVLLPLDNMDEHKLALIAPHQHSDLVRNALMKSKRDKAKNKKLKKPNNSTESSSIGYSAI